MGFNDTYLNVADIRYLIMFGNLSQTPDDNNRKLLYAGENKNKAKGTWLSGVSRQKQPNFAKRYYQSFDGRGIVADGFDISAPSDPAFTLNAMRSSGGLPRMLTQPTSSITVIEVVGKCKGPLNDLNDTAIDHWVIHSQAEKNGAESMTDGGNEVSTAPLIDSQPYLPTNSYFAGKIGFTTIDASKIAALATMQVLDVAYYGSESAGGTCDEHAIGTERIAVLMSDDGLTNSQIAYSVDGGNTWSTLALTKPADGLLRPMLASNGSQLAVLWDRPALTNDEVRLIAIDDDGVLTEGSLVALGTDRVETVFAASNAVFISAAAEHISRIVNGVVSTVATGYESIPRCIATNGDLVVIGTEDSGSGTQSAVFVSDDGGLTWSGVTAPTGWSAAGFDITAIYAHSEKVIDVGTSTGLVLRTRDGGKTWGQLLAVTAADEVTEIAYASEECGIVTTLTEQHWTLDGENFHAAGKNRRVGAGFVDNVALTGQQLGDSAAVAFPSVSDLDVRVNYCVMGGASGATAGWLAIGKPTYV